MKKVFIIVLLLILCLTTKATPIYSLVIATVDTSYAHYNLYLTVVDSDVAHITELGSIPQPPVTASTNAAYNNYNTVLNIYDSSLIALNDTLSVHSKILRTLEIAVLATLGYSAGGAPMTPLNSACDQWIQVQGNSFTTAWIGVSSYSTYLTVVYTLPTISFTAYRQTHQ